MSYADDPNFYCHGQACIDQGCSPLVCADQDARLTPEPPMVAPPGLKERIIESLPLTNSEYEPRRARNAAPSEGDG